MKLTDDELRFFKRQGYLILRDVMDPHLMARARDRLWDNPPPSVRRDEPESWIGPIRAEEESLERENTKSEYSWSYRKPGSEEWMIRLLATAPPIWSAAEQLLGKGQLVTPERIRGIYCTLPRTDRTEEENRCHCDGHAFSLGVVGYIDDVQPDGGAFSVWPGSHQLFYPTFTQRYMRELTSEYESLRQRLNQQPPVDCFGSAGDIVFWHQRLGHMAGHNHSQRIRQAVLYDFLHQSVKATAEDTPHEEMWTDWSDELRQIED
jgi:hypothetical protein